MNTEMKKITKCKHDWHFVEGTDTLRCQRCGKHAGGFYWGRFDGSRFAIPTGQLAGYTLRDARPANTIQFYGGNEPRTEVLRLSQDGIWANPDIPTDDAAKQVLAAIDTYIKGMVERVRSEVRQACAREAELQGCHMVADAILKGGKA